MEGEGKVGKVGKVGKDGNVGIAGKPDQGPTRLEERPSTLVCAGLTKD